MKLFWFKCKACHKPSPIGSLLARWECLRCGSWARNMAMVPEPKEESLWTNGDEVVIYPKGKKPKGRKWKRLKD